MLELIEFIKKNCYTKTTVLNSKLNKATWWEKKNAKQFYDQLLELTKFLPAEAAFNQRIWHILNQQLTKPVCGYATCGNITNWQLTRQTYSVFCSRQCAALATSGQRKDTVNQKYGVDNYAKSQQFKTNLKETLVKKYGVDNYAKSQQFKDNYIPLASVQEQARQDKRKDTCQLKYGVDTAFQADDVKIKIKQTLGKHYNVGSPLQSAELLEKQQKTMLARYGRKNFQQRHLSVSVLNNLHCATWFEKELSTKSLRTVAEENNIAYTTACRLAKFHGYQHSSTSTAEQELFQFIKSIYPGQIIKSDRQILDKKEIDILLPDLKLGFEFNGIFWHSEHNGKDKWYHVSKTNLAAAKDIKLIHIYESEWEQKQLVVQNKIKYLLGIVDKKIFARHCQIKEISNKAAHEFFQTNHLQGWVAASVTVGCYFNNNLVAAMSFGKSRFSQKYQWEMLRFCVQSNFQVVGGASKLFSFFRKHYQPQSVVSYADRRWAPRPFYSVLNFTFSHNSAPGYYYVNYSLNRLESRYKYQKHKLAKQLENYNPALTASENMQMHGFGKIWDCGNSVWVFKEQEINLA